MNNVQIKSENLQELADDELNGVAGGGCGETATNNAVMLKKDQCPSCGSVQAVWTKRIPCAETADIYRFRCASCNTEFELTARSLSEIMAEGSMNGR